MYLALAARRRTPAALSLSAFIKRNRARTGDTMSRPWGRSIAAMSGVYSGCAVTCSNRDLNCVLSFSPNWFDVMDVASPSRQQEASTSGPPVQQQVGRKVHDQRDHD